MIPWMINVPFPVWRVRDRLSPFRLPFAPSSTDVREWQVEIDPASTPLPQRLPRNGNLSVSLHRLLIETGIALTRATSSWDPRTWYALYRYGADFAGTSPCLRFYSGVTQKDPRPTAVASEEVATGISCYLLRENFGLLHIADVYECIQRGELSYVDPTDRRRPDYFGEDSRGKTVLAESKGSTGTRSSISKRIDPEGWEQVQNVKPVNLPLGAACGRVVIGTHFCIEGKHKRSETTTIIKDPKGSESELRNPESDTAIRLSYAKALRFMGQDVLAESLIYRRGVREISDLIGKYTQQVGPFRILPLSVTPFGDIIGLYEPIASALFSKSSYQIRAMSSQMMGGLEQTRLEFDNYGYILSNGVAVVHVTQAGATKTLDTYSHSTATLAEIETRLTDRFDDVAYYAYSGAP